MKTDWQALVAERAAAVAAPGTPAKEFLDANANSVEQVLRGLGPENSDPKLGAGVRIVFNMSCKHVQKFCAAGSAAAYKNAYDLNKVSPNREQVDLAVADCAKGQNFPIEPKDIYFGAVEISGTGIAFYGDMCLVLDFRPAWPTATPDPVSPRTRLDEILVLDRNSYDVIRAPIGAKVLKRPRDQSVLQARSHELTAWVGTWSHDLVQMLTLKAIDSLPAVNRRWTTGQIAEAVLEDEDYVEVLYPQSFCAHDLFEVRISAADAAAEGDIADRERSGEGASLHELEWRQQRREARRALARSRVPVRVVTTPGRVKGT